MNNFSIKLSNNVKNFLFLALLLFSCSKSEDFDYKEFSLSGREVGPTDFFGNPTGIISDGGRFIIADVSSEMNFHYLNESLQLINSIGSFGDAPTQLKGVVDLPPIQGFSTYPFRVLSGFELKENDLRFENNMFNLVQYPKDLLLTQNIIIISDSVVWGQGGSEDFKFIVVNTKSGEVLKEIPFGSIHDFFDSNNLPFAFYGNGFYHPWWDRVVWSQIKLNTIEFYLPNGDFEREWVFGAPWTEEELKSRYPVLLRSVPIPNGLLVMHIKEAKDLANNSTVANLYYAAIAKIKTRILFFNEGGEVKWSLKLDRFLNDFTFDVENKRIVGVFGESEKQNIVVYELPEDLLREIGF